jgi:hypothetical protein
MDQFCHLLGRLNAPCVVSDRERERARNATSPYLILSEFGSMVNRRATRGVELAECNRVQAIEGIETLGVKR